MRATVCTRYGSPDVLELQEVKKPIPKENEICIKNYATSVTSSDCFIRGFSVPFKLKLPMALAIGLKKPRQPILGMVIAGEVESIGNNVTRFKVGDEVFGFDRFRFGAYAEYKCMSEEGVLALKPKNLSYIESAAIPYGGLLSLPFLRKGNITQGKKVLIYGASGAVGTSAVQLVKYFGAEVTGVCSNRNLEMVKSMGATNAIDYAKDNLIERAERYDFIFDAVGKRKSANMQFNKVLTHNGKFISVDDGSPKISINDLLLLKELVELEKYKPVIDRCYKLEQMAEAHQYVDEGHKKGNVVITIEHSMEETC